MDCRSGDAPASYVQGKCAGCTYDANDDALECDLSTVCADQVDVYLTDYTSGQVSFYGSCETPTQGVTDLCCTLDLASDPVDTVVLEGTSSDDTMRFLDGSIDLETPSEARMYGGAGEDSLYGSNHASETYQEALDGGSDDDTIDGNDGDDALKGGSGDDTIYGRGGDDEIDGGPDDDELNGNAGNDDIVTGSGYDLVFGGANIDTVVCDDAGVVHGNGETDFLHLAAGANCVLYGDAQDDFLFGNGLPNWLFGGDGPDVIRGGGGADWLQGGEGNDWLAAGPGDDLLFGEDGDDVLWGDVGEDLVVGGRHSDTLCETELDGDSNPSTAPENTIIGDEYGTLDFSTHTDRVWMEIDGMQADVAQLGQEDAELVRTGWLFQNVEGPTADLWSGDIYWECDAIMGF